MRATGKLSAAAAFAILAAPVPSQAQPINIGKPVGAATQPQPRAAATPRPAVKPRVAVKPQPAAKPQPKPLSRPQAGAAPSIAAAEPPVAKGGPVAKAPFRDRLTAAQGYLAVDLVQQLAASKKPMLVVSPASVAGAAAALDLGASDQLRSSLHTVLGFRRDADAIADFASLRVAVDGLGKSEASLPLKFANAVVFDQGVKLYPAAEQTLKQAGVEHIVADLNAPASVDEINKRVRERTGGLIAHMIDRSPTGATLIVLNALHFKDRWKVPFDRTETKPALFHRLSGGPTNVSTMHLPQGKYLFRQDDTFVGIEMPYAQDRFSMVIVTTRGQNAAPPATFAGAGDWLSGKGFAPRSGELALPHFDISGNEDITGAIDRLGLRTARLAPDALSRFTPDPARITRIVQRMELQLNEEGTEAAAATAVVAERGVDKNYVRMVVDKPFMFALRDKETGLILMAGYVGEPTALATAAR